MKLKDWKVAGAACIDPGQGRWRMLGEDLCEPYYQQWVRADGVRSGFGPHWGPYASNADPHPSLVRAIANGPDFDDTAMLGILRLLLPAELRPAMREQLGQKAMWLWMRTYPTGRPIPVETEEEAIKLTWQTLSAGEP